MEKELAKANSTAEQNAIAIKNQPVAMGVMTGQMAHQSALDTARINAVTGMYNAKLLDQQRKDAEKAQFISQYGVDPSTRPKGMSKREFAKQITSQKTTSGAKSSGGGGTVSGRQGAALVNAENSFRGFVQQNQGTEGYDGKVSPDLYIQQRQNYVSQGGNANTFDSQYADYLSDQEKKNLGISTLTPAQQAKQDTQSQDVQQKQAKAQEIVNLVDSISSDANLSRVLGPIDSRTPTFLPGSINVESKIAQLKSLTQLANMGVMKGVLSDSDMKVIQNASNRLNQGMSINDFKSALEEIKQKVISGISSDNNNDPLGLGF